MHKTWACFHKFIENFFYFLYKLLSPVPDNILSYFHLSIKIR